MESCPKFGQNGQASALNGEQRIQPLTRQLSKDENTAVLLLTIDLSTALLSPVVDPGAFPFLEPRKLIPKKRSTIG